MKETEPIIVTQLFNTSIEQLWEALTRVEHMRQWYFDAIPDFKPEASFQTRFLITNKGRNFTHNWLITEVEFPTKISYRWTFDEYPGESISTFELSKKAHQTRLTVTSKIIKEFPTDIPEFKRESGFSGWEYLIKESLVKFLATR